MNTASMLLYATSDPASAWAYLMTRLDLQKRTRLFYVKEAGRKQRWGQFKGSLGYLYSYSRRRSYRSYVEFLDYVAGRQSPPPPEPEDEPPAQEDTTQPRLFLDDPQTVWKYTTRPRSPRL